MRTTLILTALLALATLASVRAQGIDLTPGKLLPLTDKLTNLEGTWKHDPVRTHPVRTSGTHARCARTVRTVDAAAFGRVASARR